MERVSALHGFILFSPDQSAYPPPALPTNAPFLRFEQVRVNGWNQYLYNPELDPSFVYEGNGETQIAPVYWLADNRSPRCIMVSSSKMICEHLLNRVVNPGRVTKIRAVGIKIKRLVDLLSGTHEPHAPATDPDLCAKFCVTGLVARCNTAGPDLRTVMLYGQDICASDLFRAFHQTLDPYQVGLRRTDDYSEALKVGNDGYLSFYDRGDASLEQIERCLKLFLVENLYAY